MSEWPHRQVPCDDIVGDYPYCKCACGEVFKNYTELQDHLWENREIRDGIYPEIGKAVNDVPPSNMAIPMPEGIKPPRSTHSWVTFWRDEAPYGCRCGQEFDTHAKLMEHTAMFNEPIESYELGRAGAAIEREAHEATLEKLNKALDFIEEVRGEQVVSFPWYDETTIFLRECGREVSDAE